MNKDILKTGVQSFINKNWNTDIVSVLLKKPFFDGISNREIAEQLEAKKKCEKKLPTWFGTPLIYYPNRLSIEQTSSETTARYKAQIVSGESLVDLTGGLGVDSFFFSQKIDRVFHCEIDSELAHIAAHNFGILKVGNLKTVTGDGFTFLDGANHHFDWVYLDPSRRNKLKGKVIRFADCLPNVILHLDAIFKKADKVLIKSAPLLDLSTGIGELRSVKEVHIVAVNNEVKELLWVLEKGFEGEVEVKTVNFKNGTRENFDFRPSAEKKAVRGLSDPLDFLYEPNAAIMKSGAFHLVGNRFRLQKLHLHTHLYTSHRALDFPGRVFKIENILPYTKKSMRQLGILKANITARNFPETVAAIRKKHRIGDGSERYLFFARTKNEKLTVLSCTKWQREATIQP